MTNCYGTINYEYDVFGNLKKVTLADGKIIEYKVDALNRRVKKLVNGVTKEYYIWYDQIHIAAILDENKTPKLVYLYGPQSNSPSFLIKDNVTYQIIHDPGLGSVRYVVNPSTLTIQQDIEYDEYGNVMKNTNPDFQPITYAGGLYDADTKLIRFGARDYDPTVGRWTTKDPIGFNGGDTNLYAYVGGNPMSYNDPKGLFWNYVAGGVIGGITSGVSAYLAGGNTDQILTAAGIGAIAGVATSGLSALAGGSAIGVIGAGAGVGMAGNAATQFATGANLDTFNTQSLLLAGLAGGVGGAAGLGAGNAAFFRTSVIGNPIGVSLAATRSMASSAIVSGAVGFGIENSTLMCKK